MKASLAKIVALAALVVMGAFGVLARWRGRWRMTKASRKPLDDGGRGCRPRCFLGGRS